MTDSVRPRKCCPICGSLAVSKYTGYKHTGTYRCGNCGATGVAPVLKDIHHSKKGWALSGPRAGGLA